MQKKLKNKLFVILLTVICCSGHFSIFAQDDSNDLILLKGAGHHSHEKHHHHSSKSLVLNNKPYQKYNPVNLLFGGLMFVYQNAISSQLSSECLYEVSCSNYSKALIAEYGIAKGIFLTADRLMRCNRIASTNIPYLRINPKTGKVIEDVNYYKAKVD